MRTILIVDDEDKIRDVISSYLERDQMNTLQAASGEEALSILREQRVDFVILDLMLPGIDGEKVCQEIRTFSPVPVLMLTAKSAQTSRIEGLSIGADDYMIKPFDPRELVARIKAILRRVDDSELLAEVVQFHQGELVINSARGEVLCRNNPISLTPSEYKLLLLLAKYPQRLFSREELIDRVLGYHFIGDVRIIDQHVKNLRQKLELDPRKPKYVMTVFGFGYRFGGGD